jgi:hypothetical protein
MHHVGFSASVHALGRTWYRACWSNALLNLWRLDDMPACRVGVELARAYLIGEGVDRLGSEELLDRITEMTTRYQALVDHGATCHDCQEL